VLHEFRFSLLLAAVLVVSTAWPAGQVVGPAQAGAPQATVAGTGFIAGQVVDATTGRPIGEATVLLLRLSVVVGGRGSGVLPVPVVTDPSGRFFFSGLGAGSYSVRADRVGYTAPRGLAVAIDLADGDRQLNTRVRLARNASISGMLRDTAGDPIVGTEVLTFRRVLVNGRPSLQSLVRGIKSDDRGAYRIPALPPGEYLICACLREPIPLDPLLLTTLASQPLNLMSVAGRALTVGADVVSLDNSLRMYAPTFHPDSTAAARATRVTVAAGEEKIGIDITSELVRLTRVSGRVVGAQGPVVASSIRLVPAADADAAIELMQIQPMLVQADGRFDFASVPPGQYRLMVAHRETGATGGGPTGLALGFTGGRGASPPPPPVAVAGPGVAPPPLLWANELISVGEGGVRDLVISLEQTAAITGRLELVGGAPAPTEQMFGRTTVLLAPVVSLSAIPTPVGPVSADKSFRVTGAMPGKYIVQSGTLPGYPTLKSVTLGGADITDLPLEVSGRNLTDLVLTYGDTPLGSLAITVPQRVGQPSGDEAVLIFPADRKYWSEPSAARRRFRTAALSTKGTATASDIPAGEYFVVLVTGPDAFDWQEAPRLDTLSRTAQRIGLTDGEKKTIEVRR
jgi:hypothetical protein